MVIKQAALVLGAALVLVGGGMLAWHWPRLSSDALTAASFGARNACACRFIEGRDLKQCRDDFEPGMGPVMLSEDEATKSVTARFPLLAKQTAHLVPGAGCQLDKWSD
ncbi:hypothetical protein EOE18_09580 [Novosphingobium umbonatum]|uniref:Amidase n=1 Tax=Novosphingobium umbonatum TaxID=1908524 RepID=A0A3S2X3R8_9SPHN|nr:hypothetical protein EOE18_09580 [Novosphingobium umbonatum]